MTGRRPTGSDEIPQEYFSELLDLLEQKAPNDKSEVHTLKLSLCKKYRLRSIPSDPEILAKVPSHRRKELGKILRLKPMRTASGVSPVAVMTSPEDCPHGVCIYCPGGVDNDSPQSYTGQEPAALRAGQNHFDPFLQTSNRIRQYQEIGHPTDKIDLIIMGGTFPSRTQEYQDTFLMGCFKAMNGHSSLDLESAHKLNESAHHRCIGITIETRPDHCMEPQIRQIQRLGGTRIELGVQTTDDSILERVKRGHLMKETLRSTTLIKDAGLKLVYHIMPGLPGSTPDSDLTSFERLFKDPALRPDMLKIYPTLVVKGTELHKMWLRGKYQPLETEDAAELIAKMKKIIPPYVRIQRIQRDIPAKLIEAGVKKSNLRQLAQNILHKSGDRCHCIRCREAGHTDRIVKNVDFMQQEYESSDGKELFLSFEDKENEVLIAYLRLRFPSTGSENGKQRRAIVRELKVSGMEVPLGHREESQFQHTGYGRTLLQKAESISRDRDWTSIIVTSGVGVRPYYRNLGYDRSGFYMEKKL